MVLIESLRKSGSGTQSRGAPGSAAGGVTMAPRPDDTASQMTGVDSDDEDDDVAVRHTDPDSRSVLLVAPTSM
jgi:hypothetical protein